MRFRDALILSTRMFKNKPLRTFLTILGVSIGIGAVLFLVSLGYGLQQVILNKITTADSLLSLDVSPGVSNLVNLNSENVEEISRIGGVVETSKLVNISSQATLDEKTLDGLIYAVDQSFFRLNGVSIDAGDYFDSDNSKEAVISTAGAKLFDLSKEEIIGKQVKFTLYLVANNSEGFEEVQVVKRDDAYTIVGLIDDENLAYFYLPLESISDLGISQFDQLKVKVAGNSVVEDVRNQIMERGFLVSALSDTIEQANKIFGVIQIVLLSFGLVALMVSAIGMFNTMTIALLEKTNEIGIMRSIGISGKDIKRIFLMEAGIVGFLGGIGGVGVGYLAGFLLNLGFNMLAVNLGGKSLDLFYTPGAFIALIIVFSTLVGLMTGVYPSRHASRLNPLDALRYK